MSDNHEHHLMSLKTHYVVIGILFVLTFLTVYVTRFDFGIFNVAIALIIATGKAVLVMGYFMHLKYDSMMNRVILGSSFFFLALFAVILFLDVFTRIDPRI
ncbi:MAG: cytochrome C oxidase subunit IV family protein [Bdellovibrionales bacterium]